MGLPDRPQIAHDEIKITRGASFVYYEISIELDEYDIFAKGEIYYHEDMETSTRFINDIQIEKIDIFGNGDDGLVDIKNMDKIRELMSLCFVSALEKESEGYEIEVDGKYSWRLIRKKYSHLVINTPPFIFYKYLIYSLLGEHLLSFSV
jgi:hypothetical protein